jgi:SAM-dependent methyltransferase
MRMYVLDVGIGTGQHGEFVPNIRGNIEVDLYKPRKKIANFIQADGEYLPFRTHSISRCYAYNLLEHVQNPYSVLRELRRVSLTLFVRQDRWYNIGNYATPSHLYFQLSNLKFLPYPRTYIGILFGKWLEIAIRLIGTFKVEWKRGKVFSLAAIITLLTSERFQYIVVIKSDN